MRISFNTFFILFVISGALYGASEITTRNLKFGVFGGESIIRGYYADHLNNGYNFGFYVNYPLFSNRSLLLESDFTYTEYPLKDSSLSEFSIYSLAVGPVWIFHGKYVKPYLGIFANINYLELNTVITEQTERVFKPGIKSKVGMCIPVMNNFSVETGLKYSVHELSGELYRNIDIYGGISYSFEFVPQETVEDVAVQIEIDEYYENGISYFKQGDGLKSKEYFNKVISYDRNYKDVRNFLEIIETSEENYRNALRLISEEKPFEALPLLIDANNYLLNAKDKLNEIRSKLSEEEINLERLGIEAYEQEEYEKCIDYLKKVQLINPENNSVKIYLPRAIKRFNALKKF